MNSALCGETHQKERKNTSSSKKKKNRTGSTAHSRKRASFNPRAHTDFRATRSGIISSVCVSVPSWEDLPLAISGAHKCQSTSEALATVSTDVPRQNLTFSVRHHPG